MENSTQQVNSDQNNAFQSNSSKRAKTKVIAGHSNSMLSRLFALPVLLAVLWAAWQVSSIGLASAWYYNSLNYIKLWQKNEQLFTEASFRKASLAIAKATELHPNHPDYLLLQAKIAEWGWYRGELSSNDLSQVDAWYQQAIRLRPTWPNAYADYAYFLGVTQTQITAAFSQLQLAQQYGPYTPEVFMQTLTVGFANWPVLNTAQKANTLAALQHSIKNSQITYQHALNITKISGKLSFACNFLRASKQNFNEVQQKQIERDFCNRKKKQ